ncbi:MAG: efflux RND transporter periplasmic adaptor subunit, partial [Proteobacteria bacterium]|nr:efflux RND transporter periplasmic adaptor subunit [Pseudomonadota bacterium]
LPPALIVRRGGRLGVFVARDGLARFHPLPMAQEGRPAAADLPADTRIVVTGHLGIRDGAALAPGTATK